MFFWFSGEKRKKGKKGKYGEIGKDHRLAVHLSGFIMDHYLFRLMSSSLFLLLLDM